jgi:hypothetical protein
MYVTSIHLGCRGFQGFPKLLPGGAQNIYTTHIFLEWNAVYWLPQTYHRASHTGADSAPILMNTPPAEMEFALDRAREFLCTTCDPQLRLVSRSCRDALAAVPRELLRVEDYLSSASLFAWARKELLMPERADIAVMAARGAHLDVLRWLRAKKGRCSWTPSICEGAAEQGHLHVLQWLRTQRPACPWTERTCSAAAFGGHVKVLRWVRARRPPCPWTEETCHEAASCGHLDVLKWLRAQDPPCPWGELTCSCSRRSSGCAAMAASPGPSLSLD